jgi:NAD(P)-dependent dehydrogenase (short-subunit alcohol dehydrogenase family)
VDWSGHFERRPPGPLRSTRVHFLAPPAARTICFGCATIPSLLVHMASDKNTSRVWFITGSSTGFGRVLADILLKRGERVAVTARNPDQIQDLVSAYKDTGLALALDVTRPQQVAAAVADAEKIFGRIDVLVNNAGYGYLAAVEEGEEEEVRAMFDANFFGLVALTKAVLPGMRARRSGHIVNLSSVAGFLANPSLGYYAATKFAVEALSEALAKEVEPLGIRVTAIEPGPFRTDWGGRSLKLAQVSIPDYEETAGARKQLVAGRNGKQPGDPVRAAEAIITIVESEQPPRNLVLGKIALDMTREKLAGLSQTIDQWEALTLGTDFPS